MRDPKVRTIYSDYDLWNDYETEARESLEENGITEPSDDAVWSVIYDMDLDEWELAKEILCKFFEGSTWIIYGYTERWDGKRRGWYIFTDFMDMFSKAAKDCNYVHIYDKNGHMFLKCSHHDGTNFYEIRKVTEKGIGYLERWNDGRSKEYIHDMIIKKYSVLPWIAYKVYGLPKYEYEEIK